jgi:hypothetical protein
MSADRQQFREYLLGKMPETLAVDFDARLFDQNTLHDELEHERESLIEDFVHGQLPAEEESLFRSQLSKSAELRQRVEDSRALLLALERVHPLLDRKRSILSQLFIPLSAVLAILLCIVSFLYVKEQRRNTLLRSQAKATQSTTTQTSIPSPMRRQPVGPSLVTAFLSANVPRESSFTPPSIVIPAGTAGLELQVELRNPPPDAIVWTVEIRAGEKIISQSSQARLHHVGQEIFLAIVLDAEDLQPGSYSVLYSAASNPTDVRMRTFIVKTPMP